MLKPWLIPLFIIPSSFCLSFKIFLAYWNLCAGSTKEMVTNVIQWLLLLKLGSHTAIPRVFSPLTHHSMEVSLFKSVVIWVIALIPLGFQFLVLAVWFYVSSPLLQFWWSKSSWFSLHGCLYCRAGFAIAHSVVSNCSSPDSPAQLLLIS